MKTVAVLAFLFVSSAFAAGKSEISHSTKIGGMEFSPDGQKIVMWSGYEDLAPNEYGRVTVRDLTTGQSTAYDLEPNEEIYASKTVFCSGNKFLCFRQNTAATLINLETGARYKFENYSFSANGKYLLGKLLTDPRDYELYDLNQGWIHTFEESKVSYLAFSPEGNKLWFINGETDDITIYDIATGQEIVLPELNDFTFASENLVLGVKSFQGYDCLISIDLSNMSEKILYTNIDNKNWSYKYDNKKIIIQEEIDYVNGVYHDGVIVIDLETGSQVVLGPYETTNATLKVSPGGNFVLALDEKKLINTRTLQEIPLNFNTQDDFRVTFSEDQSRILFQNQNIEQILILDTATGNVVTHNLEGNIVFNKSKNLVLLSDEDYDNGITSVYLLNLATGALDLRGSSKIYSYRLHFSPTDNAIFYSWADDDFGKDGEGHLESLNSSFKYDGSQNTATFSADGSKVALFNIYEDTATIIDVP